MANRILIVDDSPRFRVMAAGLLAEHGFDVLAMVEDGEQGSSRARPATPERDTGP